MSTSVLDMSMSLDGYIADPDDFLGGEDGERLQVGRRGRGDRPAIQGGRTVPRRMERGAEPSLQDGGLPELMWITGAVIMAVVPIFVPSHRPPGPAARRGYPLVTYVTDGIESAMAQAKAAAGDRDVLVHGAYTAQRALEAGVLDELQIHLIPVLSR